mgnify:CR=1 FL=1
MSFDGLFTYAVTKELASVLKGGRIIKIYQPFPNEIILSVRSAGKNYRVLLSAHPSYARAQITEQQYENPQTPPMFCMILRKHLEGNFIEDIYQADLNRMIIFKVKGKNEIGDLTYKKLIIEIMGRHSNIVLVDDEKGTIIDSIKHVSHAVNRYRTVLPGQTYVFPPAQNKLNPFQISVEDILRNIDFNSGKLAKQIVEQFSGISPLLANEIVHRAGIANRITLPKAFMEIIARIKNGKISPAFVKGEKKEHYYLFPLEHIKGETKYFSTLGGLLDAFYFGKVERDRVKQIAGDIEKLVKNEREKNKTKLKKLQSTLKKAEKNPVYQLYGELLTAHMHKVDKGMEEVTVENYYEDNIPVTIPLDPEKTPAENAQHYFNKYRKSKNAVLHVKEQMEKTEEEIIYLEGILQQLESAAPKDIEEIKEELAEQGYLKRKKQKGKKAKKVRPEPEQFRSSDGTLILVGKNNKQNDYLTMKLARKEEIWLHTKDIPGSHVVIRSREPSGETIREAAIIAAFYSKARNSGQVPVDYTKVKYVRKPNGAKPGFVLYDHHETVFVTPDAEKVASMRQNPKKADR